MEENDLNSLERSFLDEPRGSSGAGINFKRIIARALRYWYLVVLSVATALVIAKLIVRYTTPIYAVNASIIVREGDENAGARFLYNNSLVNPYRNFYNELYIMRSYPLLQEVVEQLNFTVSWYREGEVKTTEVYGVVPVDFVVVGTEKPYGKSFGFKLTNPETFTLEYLNEDPNGSTRNFENLHFNDTLAINGFRMSAIKRAPIGSELIGKSFTFKFTNPFQIAKAYSTRLRATWAEQGASVVNLAIQGPLPAKEIDFLNKFIERYQQFDVEKKNLVATKSIEFLDQQLANIGDSLSFFDSQIQNFKESHVVTNFDAESGRLLQRIESLDDQKSRMDLQENYFKYLEEYLRQSDDFDQVVPPSAVGISDNILSGLISQLTELQFGIRLQSNPLTEQNALLVERRQQIRQVKRDILEGVNSTRATQAINRKFIDGQIAEIEKRLSGIPESERALLDIRRNYSVRENLFLFLMQKRAEAGISRASTTSDISVVNPPTQEGGPITPKPVQNYSVALVIGFLLPFLGFFIAELLNDRVQSKTDIEDLTSIPIIGGIGHNALIHGNLVVESKPKSALAESFRALRSNLNYFTQHQDKKIILITSSVSSEGKTFTTINLATVIAYMVKKVLVIGADMRKPKIYSDFNLTNDIGLSTYLSGGIPLSEVIQRTSISNLYLMSGGPVPPNPGELLLLPKTEAMLQELLKEFDYIILDTPPVGLVADAFSLMPFAHHTIFMVRQDYTPRQYLRSVQELFERRDIKNISILFNDIRKTGPGYGYSYGYGYNYGYGYGYGGRKNKGGGYYTEE